jgi:hypothetical protein
MNKLKKTLSKAKTVRSRRPTLDRNATINEDAHLSSVVDNSNRAIYSSDPFLQLTGNDIGINLIIFIYLLCVCVGVTLHDM